MKPETATDRKPFTQNSLTPPSAQETALSVALTYSQSTISSYVLDVTTSQKSYQMRSAIYKASRESSNEPFAMSFSDTSKPGSLSEPLSRANSALASFHSVYDAICRINLSPASVPEERLNNLLQISGVHFLTQRQLGPRVPCLPIQPQTCPRATSVYHSIRLRIIPEIVAAAGGSVSDPTILAGHPLAYECVRSFGFSADTGFFAPCGCVAGLALSPVVNLKQSSGADQPAPTAK